MPAVDLKQQIEQALAAFTSQPLGEAALGLFRVLGYGSTRRMQVGSATAAGFLAAFDARGSLDRERALVGDWQTVEFLFQLTDAEIQAAGGQLSLFDSQGAYDGAIMESYVFLAVELRSPPERTGARSGRAYTRTELAQITRAVNRLFPMPAMVLFRHGEAITMAVIQRRLNKVDERRDVLERVTLVRDVRLGRPHRAHVEILSDLALESLRLRFAPDSFVKLHNAWRKTLDTSELNRRFYEELANWYFWALQTARFPAQAQKDADGRDSISIIRLITRLIFCWFLREKGVVPWELFDERHVNELLKSLAPDDNSYYTGVLQNLFFATLNTEMDVPGQPPNRRFALRAKDDHMIHQYWRHDERLREPAGLEALLRPVPFLNGGLFECLDERIDLGNSSREVRVDGFSTDPAKQPHVPNCLFFGPQQTVDLSQAYADNRFRQVTVSPIVAILDRYKFTVAENTPIEQEVALDPELLGLVFENLLASYNPETGTIARKATGSFYTPRYVVEFMVDEALIAHLEPCLRRASPEPGRGEVRLRELLAYSDSSIELTDSERAALISAIDRLRLLDPACGSGAFPIGALHKLVYVLNRIDPGNADFRERQFARARQLDVGRDAAIAAVEAAFATGEADYARKLYLIENCLFGVDIQPIAVQIAKLRCFISLVVDQELTDQRPNRGIIPLPNLETNFIAANSLFRPHFRGQGLLTQREIEAKKAKLRDVRHRHFLARKYSDKKALRKDDAKLRRELVALLEAADALSGPEARMLADWDPYHADQSGPFFDPDWMFNLSARPKAPAATVPGNFRFVNELAGQMELLDAPPPGSAEGCFDIVIGNPPYVRQEELKGQRAFPDTKIERPLKDALKPEYFCYTGTSDLYVYFYERSVDLLRPGGVLSFITSNKYFRAAYGEKLRLFLASCCEIRTLIDFGDAPVFTAIAYPSILIARKTQPTEDKQALRYDLEGQTATQRRRQEVGLLVRAMNWDAGQAIEEFPRILAETGLKLAQSELRKDGWRLESGAALRLLEKMRRAGPPLGEYARGRVYNGIKTGLNTAFVLSEDEKTELLRADPSSAPLFRRFIRGRDVKRWGLRYAGQWLLYIPWHFPLHEDPTITKASKVAEDAFRERHPAVYRHLSEHKDDLMRRDKAETGIRYEWYALARPRPEATAEFSVPKVFVPSIDNDVNYAPDERGYLGNDKTTFFVPPSVPFALAVVNSRISWWITQQSFASRQGGFYEFKPLYFTRLPVPDASETQQRLCSLLVTPLTRSVMPKSTGTSAMDVNAMAKAYFEQWLNGLVYELFFSDELHNRGIRLFDETAKLGLPDLSSLPEADRAPRLAELFERAYDIGSPLRAMLFSLQSLEVVRVIEGEK